VPDQLFVLSSIGFSVGRFQMRNLQGRLEDLNSVSYGQLNASAPKQYGLFSAGVSTQANFLMSKDQDLWNFYVRGDGSFGCQGQDTENEVVGCDYGQGGTFIVPTTTSLTRSTLEELLATPILMQVFTVTEAH